MPPFPPPPASDFYCCRMQLTLHATRRKPHGASLLAHAISFWWVKTRRAPSRQRGTPESKVLRLRTCLTSVHPLPCSVHPFARFLRCIVHVRHIYFYNIYVVPAWSCPWTGNILPGPPENHFTPACRQTMQFYLSRSLPGRRQLNLLLCGIVGMRGSMVSTLRLCTK